MSQITEYLNLIVKGIPHTKEILSSVINQVQLKYGTLPEDQKNEIIRRKLICQSCPFMSRNAISSQEYKDLTGKNYPSVRKNEHCSLCGCPLETRTASLDSDCGVITWNKENPDKQIELKWTKYERQSTENRP